MIEDTKTVKSIATKVGGKSGTYWTITWRDGKSDNIFNADWLPILERSQTELRPVHFTKENKEGSKYYNIISLELLEKPPDAVKPAATTVNTTTRENSIEAQVAFKGFIELCANGKLDVNKEPMLSVIQWGLAKMGLELPPAAPELKSTPSIPKEGKMIPKTDTHTPKNESIILPAQQIRIKALAVEQGVVEETRTYMTKTFGKQASKDLTKTEADKLIKALEGMEILPLA